MGKLFGSKGQPAPGAPPADPPKAPDVIRVFDGYGREIVMTRQQWRDNLLLGKIKQVWDQPDELHQTIVQALTDGFRSDVVDAARHLHEIDPIPSRGACLWGVVLTEENRLDEAESIFREFLAEHGEDGVILANFAKVISKRGDALRAAEMLWHALEVDPNQENGFAWHVSLHRERGGEEAELAAMRQVAALPGSWRAQLWLARNALQSRHLDEALSLYGECLSRISQPVPAELLMQMSGDLGNAGHLPEILQFVEPHFDVAIHGLQVGNNLVKAHLDLGQLDDAKHILDQLYSQKRPDWQQNLAFWDTEIAKLRVATLPKVNPGEVKIAMLTIDGPVWLKRDSPAAELFPVKSKDGTVICFLGSSVEKDAASQPEAQMADAEGRFSRALPLFLAEQVEFFTNAGACTLVPWVIEPVGSFGVMGAAWSDENAAACARREDLKADYVIITHLVARKQPWRVELRLVRTIDVKCLGTLEAAFTPANPQEALPNLAGSLFTLLADEADISLRAPAESYEVPPAEQFPRYLLRLEQLLVVRCGAMEGSNPSFISGEHEIINGNIQDCLASTENVTTRLVLAQSMLTLKKVRPDILPIFRDRIALLQKDHPLPEPAHSVVQRLFNDALAE